jgi:hypothetical protein
MFWLGIILHNLFAGERFGPDEEHEASSVESDHDHDSENKDMHEPIEGKGEETLMSPEDTEDIRDDTGNWSDEEVPRPHRTDILQSVPAAVRREVRKAHNGLGHPSKTSCLRMMHLANAIAAAERYDKVWECPA